jgi:hypothetical protein
MGIVEFQGAVLEPAGRPFYAQERTLSAVPACPFRADIVAKVENRRTPKISRKSSLPMVSPLQGLVGLIRRPVVVF